MDGRSLSRRLLASLTLIAACTAGDKAFGPQGAISDAAHSGGTAGFYFLPPLVPQPVTTGVFDADILTVNPEVAICDVTGGPDPACGVTAPAVRTFTVSSAPAIVLDGEKYKVDWDTKEGSFSAGRTYRLRVFGGSGADRRELGFADVLLTSEPGRVKNLADGETIVLNDGRTLPIHFRVEQGVIVPPTPPGPARTLEVSGLPASLVAGALASLTVTARDEHGQIATGYQGTLTFTATDPQATLPADYTFTAADAGAHTFTDALAFTTAGEVTVRMADAADATLFVEVTLTVEPADAATLDLSGLVDAAAGTAQTLTVTALDENGNVAAGYTGTIAFTSTDAQATLPAEYTFTAADAGVRTFSGVTLRTAGSVTVRAVDQAVATISGAQTVTIAPDAAAELVLSGVPDPSTAGVALDVTVTARDAFGNTATGYTATVQFSSTDPQALLPAAYPFPASDAGVRTFAGGVTFTTAGAQTLAVTDGTLTAGVSITVDAAAASLLRFTTQPTNALESSAISPPVDVTAYDAFDNVALSFAGHVTIAIGTNPGGGTLAGTAQAAATQGVASFHDLSIDQAGTGYTLVATAAGLTSATSVAFDIIAVTPPEAHWVNAAGGLWSVGSNWDTGTPPTPEQHAFIDLDGTYTVTLDASPTVDRLTIGAASGVQTLVVASARALTLSTSGTILSSGRLTLNSGTINGSGMLTNAAGGGVTIVTGRIDPPVVNAGTILVTGNPATLNGGLTTVAGSTIRVQSVGFGGAALSITSSVTNHGTIELTGTVSNGSVLAVSGTLVNAPDGTIDILPGTAGGGRTLTTQLANQGTLTVAHPLTMDGSSADHVNSGSIELTGGNLAITQSLTTPSFTNTGTISVGAGLTWSISGGTLTHALGATLGGGGALVLSSVNPAVFEAAFDLSALTLSSTVASFTTDLTTETLALTLNTSTMNGPGILTNTAGQTLPVNTSVINAALINAGTLVATGSSSLNGGVTTATGSILRALSVGFGGTTLTVGSGFTNHGTIELTGTVSNGTGFTVNGTLVNDTDGSIAILPGTAGGARTLTAQLDNRGTVTVAQSLTLSRGSADHLNSGLIELTGGNLALTQSSTTPSFTNNGTITVGVGRTWTISGGALTQSAGATLGGGGAVQLSGVNPAVFQSGVDLGALTLSATTASFAHDVSTTLSLTSSTVSGPGTVTNAAGTTMALTSSTISAPLVNAGSIVAVGASAINGPFTTVAGSLLRATSVGFGGTQLTVGSGFTNHGTIELTGTATNGLTFTVNGTLTNAPDGTIAVLFGVGGARTFTAHLVNQGTVNVSTGVVINRAGVDHSNSGTVNVLAGGSLNVSLTGTTPSFANTGTISVAAGGAFINAGGTGAFENGAGGQIVGSGIFQTNGGTGLNNAGSITAGLVRVAGPLTSTAAGGFAPITTEFFGTLTQIPVGAGFAYGSILTTTSTTIAFTGSPTVNGSLIVAGTSNLSIGALQVTVLGNVTTQGSGVLTMNDAAGVLDVSGNAIFGGGSTSGRLTAGTLEVGGNFTQSGNAAAFAASSGHRTVLNGAAAQTVSFANPGTALSHFQRLEIATASTGGVVLASAVAANGQLRTPAGADMARTISGGFTVIAGGLDAYGLVLDGVAVQVLNGEAIARFDHATFRNMDPAATQLRLDRLDDAVTFTDITFETVPTTGLYLHLVDTDLGGALFTVTMHNTTPANHGGKVIESLAGQLQGWPF